MLELVFIESNGVNLFIPRVYGSLDRSFFNERRSKVRVRYSKTHSLFFIV